MTPHGPEESATKPGKSRCVLRGFLVGFLMLGCLRSAVLRGADYHATGSVTEHVWTRSGQLGSYSSSLFDLQVSGCRYRVRLTTVTNSVPGFVPNVPNSAECSREVCFDGRQSYLVDYFEPVIAEKRRRNEKTTALVGH